MNLNLFKNLKKDINSNDIVKNFMEELANFLGNITSSKTQNSQANITNETEIETSVNEISPKDKKLQNYRKEGHLYLITEDRDNKIYLWDFTDKPRHEFEETNLSKELLNVAKEGAMLQYKNGKYELYSENGYDMLFNEKIEK